MRTLFTAAATALALCPMSLAQTPEAAAERLEAFLGGFPDLGPGYAVVAVTAEDTLLTWIDGERRASTGAPLTADTPIYIASQTKAFMGLLAARLDAEGVLSLDSTITDHWPDVEFPDGVNPADYTMRDLITHQVPIDADLIVILDAYITRIDPADYPALIAAVASAREPGFDYGNIGYNIYGAILETVTGKTWQDWLDDGVLDPLGLEHTSARTSDFDLEDQSWNHIWTGAETGWFEVRPKTDAQMQAAGGMTMSAGDMGRWLQMNLRGEGPAGSGLTSAILRDAHSIGADVDREARNAYELPCYGYALGWNVCDFEGHTLYIHGGGYTGARTMMAFSPDLGVGVAAFSNSDNQTGWLTSRTVVMFLQFVIDHEDAERWVARRQEIYPERIDRLLTYRQDALERARGEAMWQGWAWEPSTDALGDYVGVFDNADMYAPVWIEADGESLRGGWGDLAFQLAPAAQDLFAAAGHPLDELTAVQFERDANGAVIALEFDGNRFVKR